MLQGGPLLDWGGGFQHFIAIGLGGPFFARLIDSQVISQDGYILPVPNHTL